MTWKINIRGQVQGVGFRPFVWRAAKARNLQGSVANGLEGVVIQINATHRQALDFQIFIVENAPPLARITHYSIEAAAGETFFDNFTIEESKQEGPPTLLLTPDMALCAECRREIQEPGNRRYRYAFTTCTVCGPRYSILTGVPYDRALTTMHTFEMCDACRAEYEAPDHRRYFAQTNSCVHCGIQLRFVKCTPMQHDDRVENLPVVGHDEAIKEVVAAWRKGDIVAVKGVGGYLLTCDATHAKAVAALRTRKRRPAKPFALMYPSLEHLEGETQVCDEAARLLQSPAAPIVLLELLAQDASGLDRVGIAPGLHKIGVMLPYAPLFELLLRDFGGPIVATSANISHQPLVYEDAEALRILPTIADAILLHNRDIALPQDDSVVALRRGKVGNMPLPLRRARGYAPVFLQPGLLVPDATVLALGAEMKGAFLLAHLGNLNISQYLGDLTDYDTQERYKNMVAYMLDLFKAKPSRIVGDLHPGYFTTQLGHLLAEQWQCPFVQVQHHEAHFAAVLAENDLLKAPHGPVLGVVWDGTGYGRDGQIWGGEFFVFSPQKEEKEPLAFQRCAHFAYFPLLLGDKMPREPRISALAVCADLENAAARIQPKFTETEWKLYAKMATNPVALKTSSVGRIFDAVAALLGLADKVSYEGEAALLLENMAGSYGQKHGFDFDTDYAKAGVSFENDQIVIKTSALFRQIIQDLDDACTPDFVAAKFHCSMVEIIKMIAQKLNIHAIAFSGGVFQNALLSDLLQARLNPDYQLFFHQQLSPNDENIAFGQWRMDNG